MNIQRSSRFLVLAALLGVLQFSPAHAAPMTYQGRLETSGGAANGAYDFTFQVFPTAAGGAASTPPITNNAIVVSNGLFTTLVNFADKPNAHPDCWLEVGVRAHGTGAFVVLSPRQPITATPFAWFADLASNVPPASITATGIASGQLVKSLNGLRDDVLLTPGTNVSINYGVQNNLIISATPGTVVTNAGWGISGNTGTTAGTNFIGTTDGQPLELKANSTRGLRLESVSQAIGFSGWEYSINLLAGQANNAVSNGVVGATIAGGGYLYRSRLIGPDALYPNVVTGDFGSIGGGYNNTAGDQATVPGGANNSATGAGSFAAGRNAHATNDGAFVWNDGTAAAYSTAANTFDVHAEGGLDFYTGSGGLSVQEGGGTPARPPTTAIYGVSFDLGGNGVVGQADSGTLAYAVWGKSSQGYGGRFDGGNYGVFASSSDGYAGYFAGAVQVQASSPFSKPQLFIKDPTSAGWARLRLETGTRAPWDLALGTGTDGTNMLRFYNTNHGDVVTIAEDGTMAVNVLTIRGGADVAEPFEMSDQTNEPGTVVVIDEEHTGRLKQSDRPYDTRVAGVISGANGIKPGLSLRQEGALGDGRNVALTGRVYVWADAASGAIKPGDLLTTAERPGHAMRVADHSRAQGAILGKAMSSLKSGRGLVLVLVTLQ